MKFHDDGPRIGYHENQSPFNNVTSFLDLHRKNQPDKTALFWLESSAISCLTGIPLPSDKLGRYLATPRLARGSRPQGPEQKSSSLVDENGLSTEDLSLRKDSSSSIEHNRMSFGELANKVETVSLGLYDLGLRAGDRVFVFVPMSPELYLTMFAVQRLGAVAVFLDSWSRRDQLASCASQVDPAGFIAPEPAFAFLDDVKEVRSAKLKIVTGSPSGKFSSSLDELLKFPGHRSIEAVKQEDTALITFTTGSSGVPKGANRTHRFLAAQHRALDKELPYSSADVDLTVFPIFSLNNIAGGVSTVLPAVNLANPAETDGRLLLQQMRTAGVTCCTLSPSLLRSVFGAVKESGLALPGLRRVVTGGAPISVEDAGLVREAAPRTSLVILYGSTEVEPIAHLESDQMPLNSPEEGVCVGTLNEDLESRLIKIFKGPIVLGTETFSAWQVKEGEVGELVVSGEHVCRDYYKNPDAFARAKIVDESGRLWHRTGDLCRFDPQGRLWFVGRVHNAILRAGKTLFPVKPELIMKRLPFVASSAYVGIPDSQMGERAVAVFTTRPGVPAIDFADEVEKALRTEQIVADDIRLVDEIPLDPRHHSKVDYQQLRGLLLHP